MQENILKYLSKYTRISPRLERAIAENTFFETLEKGAVLLKEGGWPNKCYFVLNGCIRSYFLKDGDEKTVDFYTEEQVVIPWEYEKSTVSSHYLECIEETTVCIGTPELEQSVFQTYPELQVLAAKIGEAIMRQKEVTFADFKSASPEERYLNFLQERPGLIDRVPQSQIASYLGVKPESLSRIKKRIKAKEDLA